MAVFISQLKKFLKIWLIAQVSTSWNEAVPAPNQGHMIGVSLGTATGKYYISFC